MTKFEKAKRQAIRKWRGLLNNSIADLVLSLPHSPCGFCVLYMCGVDCSPCPIYKYNGESCNDGDSFYQNISPLSPSDCMAVLCYLHTLEKPK